MNFGFFISELRKLLSSDKVLLRKICIFTVILGLFELTVPFSVQVIINRIYKTFLYEQLFSIVLIALICLSMLSMLLFVKFNLVETVQRAIFAKISENITDYLADKDDVSYSLKYFEVVSLKKFVAKFLTDGISLIFSLVFGFVILVFYHPFFATLALLIVVSYIFLLRFFHQRSAKTAIEESTAKYRVATLVNKYFHSNDNSLKPLIDKEKDSYLKSRHQHFRLLRTHYIIILLMFIISHLILLGVGGTFVLMGELTMGQLVASELIFSTILIGMSKSIKYIETYYDSYAGLEKLSFIKTYNNKSHKLIDHHAYSRLYRWVKVFLMILPISFTLIPWVQTSEGIGVLTTLKPEERVQDISALVDGRISKWFVSEGQFVKEGDPLVEIVDNDPKYSERLKVDRDAAYKKYQAAKMAAETALLDFDRKKQLYKNGLTSRVSFEKAKIDYHKLIAIEAEAASSLAKKEVTFARQQQQVITAPSDGYVQQLYSGNKSSSIKTGTKLATFVPKSTSPAVELYVDGNDIPLIHIGRMARLEFEGFPAFQFSGWPDLNFGTFAGKVVSVDSTSSGDGKFRVMVAPVNDTDWPNERILRRGAKVKGWILMNTVTVGYELWRQFNGFPPLPDDSAIKRVVK